jgi:hypothetical protein
MMSVTSASILLTCCDQETSYCCDVPADFSSSFVGLSFCCLIVDGLSRVVIVRREPRVVSPATVYRLQIASQSSCCKF